MTQSDLKGSTLSIQDFVSWGRSVVNDTPEDWLRNNYADQYIEDVHTFVKDVKVNKNRDEDYVNNKKASWYLTPEDPALLDLKIS